MTLPENTIRLTSQIIPVRHSASGRNAQMNRCAISMPAMFPRNRPLPYVYAPRAAPRSVGSVSRANKNISDCGTMKKYISTKHSRIPA